MKTYEGSIEKLAPNQVFVFGSNREGFHGAGSAGFAMLGVKGNRWRTTNVVNTNKTLDKVDKGTPGVYAVKGIAFGYQEGVYGRSYAICTVTRSGAKRSIKLEEIEWQIRSLYKFSRKHPELEFIIASGTGRSLNGYSNEEMAGAYCCEVIPNNIVFNRDFYEQHIERMIPVENAINATGHRKIWDYDKYEFVYVNNPEDPPAAHVIHAVELSIRYYRESQDIDTWISGMALGFDMIVATAVINARNSGVDVRLVAAVPYPGQSAKWFGDSVHWYKYIISEADSVVTLFEDPVDNRDAAIKLDDRNKYMVDRAKRGSLSYYKGEGARGGTYNCIQYAKSIGRTVVNINPYTMSFDRI